MTVKIYGKAPFKVKKYIKNKAIRKKHTYKQVKHSKGSENMIK